MVTVTVGPGLGGCHGAKPPVVPLEPRLSFDELAPGLPAADNGYRLLADQPTVGRFACSLAVAKLSYRTDFAGDRLSLDDPFPTEQVYWAEQMRGVEAVRELVFLTTRTLKPEGADLTSLCDRARRLGAPLLLVYLPNRWGPNSGQVLGVLYESSSQQALATLHASATILDEEGQEASPDRKRGEHRQQDACYQAARAFEANTLACLRELMHRDSAPLFTQPHRWEQPFIERWWIRGWGGRPAR